MHWFKHLVGLKFVFVATDTNTAKRQIHAIQDLTKSQTFVLRSPPIDCSDGIMAVAFLLQH